MRCYVESLAIYPVVAHRSSDYEQHLGARAAAVQAPPTVAPASRKLASGFTAGQRRGEAGRVRRDGGGRGDKAMTQLNRVMAWFSQARRSEGAGLAGSGASAVTERRGSGTDELPSWHTGGTLPARKL